MPPTAVTTPKLRQNIKVFWRYFGALAAVGGMTAMPANAVHPAPPPAAYTAPMVMQLSTARFRRAWFAIVAARLVCISFLLVCGSVYHALASSELEWYMNFLTPVGGCFYPQASWVFVAMATAHAIELSIMIVRSVRARELVFVDETAFKPSPRVRRWWAQRAFKRIFSRVGVFGVASPYFKIQFLIRESIEMASQTAQVYQASALIGRFWINHVYAITLCVNAWSTAVIERYTRYSPPLERLLCLCTDLVLDAVMSIALPVVIVIPHYLAYDYATSTFPADYIYTLRTFNRLIMENRQVFARNWSDLVLKLIPHVSMLGCLRSIQSLLHRSTPPHPRSLLRDTTKSKMDIQREPNVPDSTNKARLGSAHLKQAWLNSRHHFIHAGFMVWGTAVLTLHVMATVKAYNTSDVPVGCMQYLRPWLTSKVACSIYKYDCTVHGTLSPDANALEFLDEKSIVQLVFANCPRLVMPSTIQELHVLLGIDIWGSAIAEWGSEAAITPMHTGLAYLGFLETNMTAIPAGLLGDMPPNLMDIEITYCNLSSLPDNLDEKWPYISSLFIEHCEFDAVPTALTKMAFYDMSLVGNKLTNVDALTDNVGGFHALLLSGNPLSVLPNTSLHADILGVDDTLMSSFPAWVVDHDASPSVIYAYGSPFCSDGVQADEGTLQTDIRSVVSCVDENLDRYGRYPVALVKALNSD